MAERQLSQAEQETRYERLAYAIEKMIERNRKKIYRRHLDGGCVLLQPGNYWGRRSKCNVVLSVDEGDGVFKRAAG
jgi:hypothetical protein